MVNVDGQSQWSMMININGQSQWSMLMVNVYGQCRWSMMMVNDNGQRSATLKTGNRLFCYISRGDCIKAKDPEGTIQFKVPEASLFILLIYVNMS